MEQVARDLERDLGIVVFPEGTSGKGDEILRFKPSLLDFAARRDLPVHFAALSYATPDGYGPPSRLVCWWGDAPFLPHFLELLRLPSFRARLVFGDAPVHDPDRKILAEDLRRAVAEQFVPMP